MDKEYYIVIKNDKVIYNTIRDKEPLSAVFSKDKLDLIIISAELENDEDEIKKIIRFYLKDQDAS